MLNKADGVDFVPEMRLFVLGPSFEDCLTFSRKKISLFERQIRRIFWEEQYVVW